MIMHRKRAISAATAATGGALLLLASLEVALAEQPSVDQLNAIRSSCRSDFMANCSGVTPGGKDALECLKRNVARLSAACQTAVNAVGPKPAPAASIPAASPPAELVKKPEPTQAEAPATAKPAAAPAQMPARAGVAADDALKAVQKVCTLNDLVSNCAAIAPNSPKFCLV